MTAGPSTWDIQSVTTPLRPRNDSQSTSHGGALRSSFKPCPDQGERCVSHNTGGRRGTRTPDHFLVREALYQLSYTPANGDPSLLVWCHGAD